MSNDEVLSYDSEISEESGERTLLPDGIYPFTVLQIERTTAKSGNPMVKLTLEVDGGELGKTRVFDNLMMLKSCEWKLSQFFIAIGLKKHGEPIKMEWQKVPTSKGMVKVNTETYNGNDNNKVVEYLDPEKHPYKAPELKAFVPGQL